jgi:hypothetical protein
MEERLGIMNLLSTMIFELTGSRPVLMMFADDGPDWMTRPKDVAKLIAVLKKVQEQISRLYTFAEREGTLQLARRLNQINVMLREAEELREAGEEGMNLLNPRNLPLADAEAHSEAQHEADLLERRSFGALDL